jgi:hypothetical protein
MNTFKEFFVIRVQLHYLEVKLYVKELNEGGLDRTCSSNGCKNKYPLNSNRKTSWKGAIAETEKELLILT